MKLFHVQTLNEARAALSAAMGEDCPGTERVDLGAALGRMLAGDICAPADVPGFSRATVDGYAVRARDTAGAGESIPAFLAVKGCVEMGEAPAFEIAPGECAYVPTGGMLPRGADAMVMTEFAELFDRTRAAVYCAVAVGANTVARGEDMEAGARILSRGRMLDPWAVALLSAAGIAQVKVYRPYRVAVISTGDELRQPGGVLPEGCVHDANSNALAALARARGMDVVSVQAVRDELGLIKSAVTDAMAAADVVAVSGGSSQGDKDMTARILDELSGGGLILHGLALKPGKPTIAAYDKARKTVLLGLPGHPAAALLVFELLFCDLVRERRGGCAPREVYAKMECNAACDAGKANALLVELTDGPDGYTARPIRGKSGLVSTLARADGFILTQRNSEGLSAGEPVRVRLI